jgi:hypothetical protein
MDKHPLQVVFEEIAAETGKFSVRSYSGRYMAAKECLAISGGSLAILDVDLRASVGQELSETLSREPFFGVPSDDSGFEVVYYWPNISYVKEQTPSPQNAR